jgi:nucleoside-diphosphate-sugar epimerase
LQNTLTTESNTLLVTGASGFIGSHFILDSIERDITPISLRSAHPEDLDLKSYSAVIHLAALVHQMQGAPEEEYFRINCDLTLSLAQKAKKDGVKHFIFMSTIKVYGEETTTTPLMENSPCHPNDPYGESKLTAENGLLAMISEDFAVSIIRIPLVYGERVKANMFNLIKLCDTLPLLPFGGINNRRSMVYVKNVTAFINALLDQRSSGVFIVSDSKPVSTTQLVRIILSALGKKRLLLTLPQTFVNLIQQLKPSLHQRLFGSLEVDPSASFKKLEFTPPFSTEEGVDAMVRWYRHD